jgi:hypothetical protein
MAGMVPKLSVPWRMLKDGNAATVAIHYLLDLIIYRVSQG